MRQNKLCESPIWEDIFEYDRFSNYYTNKKILACVTIPDYIPSYNLHDFLLRILIIANSADSFYAIYIAYIIGYKLKVS